MNAWENLKELRIKKQSLEISNKVILSDKTFAVYCLIEHIPNINITGIRKHPYFRDMSFSTVKRLLTTLLESDLVAKKTDTSDKRERPLCITNR